MANSDGEEGKPGPIGRVLYLGTALFATPSRRGVKVAYLQDGATLEVLGVKRGFLRVRTERGGLGWVAKDAVAEE